MKKIRGFEKVSSFDAVQLPKRATNNSAGYDFYVQEDTVVPGFLNILREINSTLDNVHMITNQVLDSTSEGEIPKLMEELELLMDEESKGITIFSELKMSEKLNGMLEKVRDLCLFNVQMSYYEELKQVEKYLKPVLVPTGVKAYMQDNEYLALFNRSSGPSKKKLYVTNGVGVVDSDYYNNEDNEGHIMVQVINLSHESITIKKGERIAQGIFTPFLLADLDDVNEERVGGHGSTK